MIHISFFFFHDTATTEIYTLSLHDALPILRCGQQKEAGDRQPENDEQREGDHGRSPAAASAALRSSSNACRFGRSEEHTSELQSLAYLVCRLLLEKKKINRKDAGTPTAIRT